MDTDRAETVPEQGLGVVLGSSAFGRPNFAVETHALDGTHAAVEGTAGGATVGC